MDPENLDVLGHLAQHYRSRGDIETARDTLEQLFRIRKPIPLNRHRELGAVYEELGNKEKARELYLAYIAGLKRVIDARPDDVSLVNILARFCLTHQLELRFAEEIVRQALVKHAESHALEVTLEQLSAASHTVTTGASNP